MAEIHLVRSEESRVVKRGPSSWAGKDRKLCVRACYLWCFLGGALWWRGWVTATAIGTGPCCLHIKVMELLGCRALIYCC